MFKTIPHFLIIYSKPLPLFTPCKKFYCPKTCGKYKNRVSSPTTDIETIKETAMKIAMAEKYGYAD
jgi:hypothetical protein